MPAFSSFCNKIVWETMSKAFMKSTNTTPTTRLHSTAYLNVSVRWTWRSSLDLPFLHAHCLSLTRPFNRMCSFMSSATHDSMILLGILSIWAIKIQGGAVNAERLARKYGFINKGKVGWILSTSNAFLRLVAKADISGNTSVERWQEVHCFGGLEYSSH